MTPPETTPALSLRPATSADWGLIRSWIARPEIQSWWGSPNAAEAEIRIALDSEAAISCMVMLDTEPIGYAHAIDASHWGPALPDGMPSGTWDIDVFIATPEQRGKGIGERAVNLLAEEVFSTTFALALSVFVSIRNETAVRAYERAGFHWVRVFEDPIFGPSWMMLRDRPRVRSVEMEAASLASKA